MVRKNVEHVLIVMWVWWWWWLVASDLIGRLYFPGSCTFSPAALKARRFQMLGCKELVGLS